MSLQPGGACWHRVYFRIHMPSRSPRMMWQNVEGSAHGGRVTHRRTRQYTLHCQLAQADEDDKALEAKILNCHLRTKAMKRSKKQDFFNRL